MVQQIKKLKLVVRRLWLKFLGISVGKAPTVREKIELVKKHPAFGYTPELILEIWLYNFVWYEPKARGFSDGFLGVAEYNYGPIQYRDGYRDNNYLLFEGKDVYTDEKALDALIAYLDERDIVGKVKKNFPRYLWEPA